jgi:transcriptional regulator with XRE-family HTH domain
MSAALELVHDSTWDGDAMPEGVKIGRPLDGGARYSSRSTAEARADRIRANVAELVGDLVDAWREHDDEALGFVSFADYTAWLFGDVSRVSIPVEARRELVAGMTTRDDLSVREIAEALGTSKSQIARDRKIMLADEDLETARVLDVEPGDVIDAEVVEQLDPYRALSPRWEALARVAAQGDRGLTALELLDEAEFAEGTGPAALSKLDRAGFVVLGSYDERRRNRRPYRITAAGQAKLDQLVADRAATEARSVSG